MKMEDDQLQQKLFKIGQLSGEGSKYHYGDDLENAVECYKEAYKLAREINDDKTERTCAFNLGAEYIALGEYKEGLDYLHKAVPPKDLSDERATGDLYFNMGLGYEGMELEEEALKNFLKANKKYDKYERNKTDMQIVCLEKCFKLYHERKDFMKAADICKQMADILSGGDELSRVEKLCERASELRLGNYKNEATDAALECKNEFMEKCKPQGQDCIVAGKIWNDLGLVFTQLQQYDDATQCFEKAVEQVRNSHKSNPQLEAVVLQNLGAAYNFNGDYQRAIKFHEDAATKYASITYRNGQGQCFTNLAFALSQLGEREMKQAEIAFHHALQAAIDTSDLHMKWQALEGLGAVNYNQGQVQDAVDFFIEALQCVRNNKAASERIKHKMMYALKGPDHVGVPYRGQGQVMYTGTHMTPVPGRRVLMSTHGPVEEHNKLSTTPRSQVIETVMMEKIVPVAGEQPAMAVVQDTTPPKARRLIRLRKKDSIGPYHHPKVALGLGSMTYDSPRALTADRRNTILQEDSSEEESSSASGTSSETESGEDVADQAKGGISEEKINKIFERPNSTQLSPVVHDGHLSQYEAQLRAKEEQEENEDSDSEEESSDDDSDDSSDDSSDDTEEGQEDNQPHAPPPVPTQSPPNTALVSARHLDTYLTPASHNVHTVADVHQQSDSSHRVTRQQQQQQQQKQTAESPESSSRSESSENDEDGDDENDEKDPYATVDTTTKLRQTNGQGNDNPADTGFKRQRSGEGRRSENFFDSDHSSLDNKEKPSAGEDGEDPYHTLKFDREDDRPSDQNGQLDDQSNDQSAQQGESSNAMKFDQLPRGQKEVIMAQYHHEHQGQVPPDLPPRDEKSSKTCVIM